MPKRNNSDNNDMANFLNSLVDQEVANYKSDVNDENDSNSNASASNFVGSQKSESSDIEPLSDDWSVNSNSSSHNNDRFSGASNNSRVDSKVHKKSVRRMDDQKSQARRNDGHKRKMMAIGIGIMIVFLCLIGGMIFKVHEDHIDNTPDVTSDQTTKNNYQPGKVEQYLTLMKHQDGKYVRKFTYDKRSKHLNLVIAHLKPYYSTHQFSTRDAHRMDNQLKGLGKYLPEDKGPVSIKYVK